LDVAATAKEVTDFITTILCWLVTYVAQNLNVTTVIFRFGRRMLTGML